MESATPPRVSLSRLDHITLPARDAQEAKRFWVELFGAEVEVDRPNFAEVKVGGMTLGFRERSPLLDRTTEAPHLAFAVEPDALLPLKAHLEAHGVPTQPLWTRGGIIAHMYFRDPSGTLFECVSSGFVGAHDLPRQPSDGGDLVIDLAALDYDWHG